MQTPARETTARMISPVGGWDFKRYAKNIPVPSASTKAEKTFLIIHTYSLYRKKFGDALKTYVKRLEELERIATSFGGVQSSFAIQAGREIRVMVSSDQVTDETAVIMARDIAKKIEAEMTYPGQIKVNVIRETRAVEYAR